MTLKITVGSLAYDDDGELRDRRGGTASFPNLQAFCDALNKGSAPSTGKQKHGPYWSPFDVPRRKGEKPDWTCLVLDFDHAEPNWDQFQGYEHVFYQTPSSTPEQHRWRVILSVTEPIPFESVDSVRRVFPGADPAAVKPTQIFWHRHPNNPAAYVRGAKFDWRATPPTLPVSDPAPPVTIEPTMSRETLTEALYALDPDMGHDDWVKAGMALHHEYAGAEAGFDEWLAWSERGLKFSGVNELRTKWNSFKPGGGITGLSLLAMQTGSIEDFPIVEAAPVDEQVALGDAQIEPCELPPYLVDELAEQGAEILLYGAQGTFKSLFGIELGICVATGTPFFERDVMSGLVLYLAGEGAGGVRRRARAVKLERQLKSIGAFVIYDKGIRFEVEADRKRLRALIEKLEERTGTKLRLLVVDTYSRYAPSAANSKTPADEAMYNWLRQVQKVRGDAAVLIVHHTGHDGSHARGTSAWNQGTDTVFRADAADDVRVFLNEKQKDGPLAPPMAFTLKSVDTGYTRRKLDGSSVPVVSVVLEKTEPPTETPRLGKIEKIGYPFFDGRPIEAIRAAWIDALPKPEGRDTRPRRVETAIERLIEKGLVKIRGDRGYNASDRSADFESFLGVDP